MTQLPSVESPYGVLWSMLALKEGWDGEGAPPPSYAAVSRAAFTLHQLPERMIVTDVGPDAVGGVALYFDSPDRPHEARRSAWMEIRNSGRILLALDAIGSGGPIMVLPADNMGWALNKAMVFLATGEVTP